jgi:hypothetical protein
MALDYVMLCRTCQCYRHLGKGWPWVGWATPESIGWEDLADNIHLGAVEPTFTVLARLLGFLGMHNGHELAVLPWGAAHDEAAVALWEER